MSSWCCPTTSLTTHLFSLYTPLSLEPYLNCNKYYFYTHESVRLLACLAFLPDWSGRGVNLVDIVLFFMLHSNGRWYIIVSQILGNSISTQCPPRAQTELTVIAAETIFWITFISNLNLNQILLCIWYDTEPRSSCTYVYMRARSSAHIRVHLGTWRCSF